MDNRTKRYVMGEAAKREADKRIVRAHLLGLMGQHPDRSIRWLTERTRADLPRAAAELSVEQAKSWTALPLPPAAPVAELDVLARLKARLAVPKGSDAMRAHFTGFMNGHTLHADLAAAAGEIATLRREMAALQGIVLDGAEKPKRGRPRKLAEALA